MDMERQLIRPAPIRKSFTVKASQQRAFDTFVARMGSWWVEGHSLLKVPVKAIVVEPHEGGRWYEEGEDGSQVQWGRVLAWEPPGRVLLAWQLTAEWAYDPDFETEVEVRFTSEGDGTRVEFEHRNLERFGHKAEEQRAGMNVGWGLLLDSFAASLG